MEDTAILEKGITERCRRLMNAGLVGLAAGLYAGIATALHRHGFTPDFAATWAAARVFLGGGNPYHTLPPSFQTPLYYPLPAVLASLPLASLPLAAAIAIFVFLSTFAMVSALHKCSRPALPWIASAPFLMAASLGQWSPLIVVGMLVPAAGYVAALKPNLGLAGFGYRPTWLGVGLALLAGLTSLALLPSWPWDWLANLKTLEGHGPPLFTLGGCWIGLAALRWRQPEARLLLAMACVPQLLFFADQLPLWLVARSRKELITLSICSMLAYMGFVLSLAPEMPSVPQAAPWVLGLIYGPALIIVLRRNNACSQKASRDD